MGPEESMRRRTLLPVVLLAIALSARAASAGTITFGDRDCLGFGCYGASDPTSGATLQGLGAGVVTEATTTFSHGFPFGPGAGDFSGTDQIFVGSVLTFAHDGLSVAAQRLNGPQVLTLDYSALVGPGEQLTSLTLGIAADDFQFPAFGQPFTATVNGITDNALAAELNALNLSGPSARFFTIGLDPSIDSGNHLLTLTINEGGDGGDGWAVDFLTVGATTHATSGSPVPEPATLTLVALGGATFVRRRAARRLGTRTP
jgi:hypothetical protein